MGSRKSIVLNYAAFRYLYMSPYPCLAVIVEEDNLVKEDVGLIAVTSILMNFLTQRAVSEDQRAYLITS